MRDIQACKYVIDIDLFELEKACLQNRSLWARQHVRAAIISYDIAKGRTQLVNCSLRFLAPGMPACDRIHHLLHFPLVCSIDFGEKVQVSQLSVHSLSL